MIEWTPSLIEASTTVYKVAHSAHSMGLSLLDHIGKSIDLTSFYIDYESFIAENYVIIVFFARSTTYKEFAWLQMDNLSPVFFKIKSFLLFVKKCILYLG